MAPDLFETVELNRTASTVEKLENDSVPKERDVGTTNRIVSESVHTIGSATNKTRETEAVKVSSPNIHMNKITEAYGSLPPKESDQKYVVEGISLRHQLGSAPDVADNPIANELGSRKVNLKNDNDPTMV